MKDEYDPHAETPDDIFIKEICSPHTKNKVTIARWHYNGLILAQFICGGFGIGIGMMFAHNSYDVLDIGPSLKVERKDVNQDGIQDLLLSDPERIRKNIVLIGDKNGTYTRIEVYDEQLEEKIKQKYQK